MVPILTLESDRWKLELTGPSRELPDFLPVPKSHFRVTGDAELRVASGGGRKLHLVSSETRVLPLLFENTTYDCYLKSTLGEDVALDLSPAARLRHKEGAFSHHVISFGNDVGWAELAVADSCGTVRLRFEVFPLKIDYRTDYVALRDEVTAMARSLAMSVHARTFSAAAPVPSTDPTLAEWVSLLKGYFEQFVRTAGAVIKNPRFHLKPVVRRTDAGRARRVDERALARRIRRPVSRGAGCAPSGVRLPSRVPEVRRRTTFDNPENRYFKYLLLQTLRTLNAVVVAEGAGDEDAELSAEHRFFVELRPHIQSMTRRVQRLLKAPFLEEVGARPLDSRIPAVLSIHPAYSAFVQTARLLNSGLSLQGGPLQIGLKDIAQLYEYWCFLRLVRLFRESFQLEQQSIVQLRHLRLGVALAKGREASLTFRDANSGRKLCLMYNPTFTGLPTVPQRPDAVIQFTSEQRMHILDAKYRLAYDDDYRRRYGGVGPMIEDINTMHRYRDAIVLPNPIGRGELRRGVVRSAVVLFPFQRESEYSKHRFFQSLGEVQIGGLPFVPGATGLVEGYIREILRNEGYTL